MAIIYVDVDAICNLESAYCGDVTLCMNPEWIDKTTSGLALLQATVIHANKLAVVAEQAYPSCSTPKISACRIPDPPKCSDVCRYHIAINDAQIRVNPSTGLKYVIRSGDVIQLFPYGCIVDRLVSAISQGEDWTVNTNAISYEDSGGIRTYNIPIMDRISGELQEEFTLAIPTSQLAVDNANAMMSFTPGIGTPLAISMCSLIASCFDGATIVQNDNGKFSATVPAGVRLSSVVGTNTCGAGGIGSSYAVKSASVNATGNILTINGAPEHTAVHTESPQSLNQNVTISSPTGTVLGGTTLSNHLVVNNPSTCRAMRYTLYPRAQISIRPVTDGTTAGVIMQVNVNGGAWINVLQVAREVIGGDANTYTVGFPEPIVGTLAIGSSVTFGSRAVSNSNGTGNSGNYAFPDLNFIGNTL